MRLHYLVSVAIVISIATSEVFSTVSTTKVSAHTVRDTDDGTSRILRTRNVGDSDDEERAGGGISVPVTEKLAALFKSSKVTDEQLQKWLDIGTSADTVFYRMKLANARIRIFSNPQFSKWVQYADDLSAITSGKGTSAISTLTAQYGDDQLYLMLTAAKTDSSSKELASRLLTDQLERWITIGKDPVKVYKLYDLQYAFSGLLRDPQFSAWAKDVDNLNAKQEGAVSMIPTLRKFYSDADLFKMAEATKSVDELESVGLKLENAFIPFWINDKQTPAKVLTELRLKATAKTLESPLFGLLAKFTDAYNVQFPKTKTTMIETLTHTFGDDKVAKMLAAVKPNDWKAKTIATELEVAQLQMWLSSGKSVDDVYNLLNMPYIRDSLNNFGGDPPFTTWIAYMNTFSIENPDKVSRLFSTMATQFTERPMMQILQAAEKFPSMESVVVTLQPQKAEKLFATGISPSKVFTTVALDNVGDAVLSSPLFTKWMSYVEEFNKKNPTKEESWFLSLRVYYSLDRLIESARKTPKTAKIDMVESEQMKDWLIKQKPPKHVFHFLNLKEAAEKALSSPNFELWVKYLNGFNQKYPGEKTTMIDSIRANYQDLHLIPILNEAAKVRSTEKLAKNLQNALIDKWIDEKVTARYLKGIGHVPSAKTMIERYTKKINKLARRMF